MQTIENLNPIEFIELIDYSIGPPECECFDGLDGENQTEVECSCPEFIPPTKPYPVYSWEEALQKLDLEHGDLIYEFSSGEGWAKELQNTLITIDGEAASRAVWSMYPLIQDPSILFLNCWVCQIKVQGFMKVEKLGAVTQTYLVKK